jgi:TRAP transporter TAXI family solute receptor
MNSKKCAIHGRVSRIFNIFRIIFILLAIVLNPLCACAFDILLGTDQKGSFSHFAGRTLCRLIDGGLNGLSCETVPSADGDVHNLTNLSNDALDICLVDSRMLHDAISREGDFKFLDVSYENLRLMTPLYSIPITIAVRKDAGITSLDSLREKRINAGAPLSPQKRVTETIMAAKGWTYEDFSLVQELPSSLSQDSMAFCHGSIQGMIHIGVHPDSSLIHLFNLCKAELLPVFDADIERWVQAHPAFLETTVPENIYPSISRDIKTIGAQGMLVASKSLDDETIYRILENVFRNQDRLKRAHPALSLPQKLEAMRDAGVEFHPGAVKFFSEPSE